MERCEYCGAEFDDEDALLDHLAGTHREDLGPIDERRVADHTASGGVDLPTGPLVLGVVIVVAVLLMAFVIFGMGGGSGSTTLNGISVAQSPDELRSAHEHGTINVTIDGQQLDFSQPRYQAPNGQYAGNKFHFEGGNGQVWHTHADGVTLEYAMATLNIGVDGDSVTYQGTTYTDGENAEVIVQVDGEPVDPSTYVLQGVGSASGQGGDHVRILVRTDG